jgi:hypothetical protein
MITYVTNEIKINGVYIFLNKERSDVFLRLNIFSIL